MSCAAGGVSVVAEPCTSNPYANLTARSRWRMLPCACTIACTSGSVSGKVVGFWKPTTGHSRLRSCTAAFSLVNVPVGGTLPS